MQPDAPPGNESKEEKIARIVQKIGSNIKVHPLRERYEDEVKNLQRIAFELQKLNNTAEEIARKLHFERREIGRKYKEMTPIPLLEYIFEVNMSRYGDEYGPGFDFLLNKQQEKGKTDDEAYQTIIQSSSTPNADVDRLLKGFSIFLNGKDILWIDAAIKLIGE